MCGRYSITANPEQVAARFDVAVPEELARPRYNAAPTQELPVVLDDGGKQMALLRWGLVPRWAKDVSVGNKLINARAESLAEKPSFRDAFKRRRCLVPADGFYEWQGGGDGKQPIRFTLKEGGLFALAGLWEQWRRPDGSELRTFTIITTEANDLVAPAHNRMPVILLPEYEALWLDQGAGPEVWSDLLRPYPPDRMAAYPVSKAVNTPGNDSPEIIASLSR